MIKVKPIFAWYDLWIGAFVDRKQRRLYVFPIPCFGIVIHFKEDKDVRPTDKTSRKR